MIEVTCTVYSHLLWTVGGVLKFVALILCVDFAVHVQCTCMHAFRLCLGYTVIIFHVENILYVIISSVLILYVPHSAYETRVKISLLKNIRTFNFRTDGSVRN